MEIPSTSANDNSKEEEEDENGNEALRFNKSLQELRDLRSQLHYAADYCEATFSHSKEKKMAVENTKEYVCRALVAMVDHLGNVSTNLNHCISETNEFSEAELRIAALKQRLVLCEQYSQRSSLNKVRWSSNLPKFHRRYLSTQIADFGKSDEDNTRDTNSVKVIYKQGFEAEDLPLFLYTYPQKPTQLASNSPSVRDGISIVTKGSNSTFHFQQISEKRGRHSLFRKLFQGNDLLSFIRRIKRTT